MIEFKHVTKAFGPRVILADISFKVAKGEIVFILGKSGMGKSVLLRNIVGLLRPDSGEIWVDGQEVSGLGEREYLTVRRRCGMVFQAPALLDSLTVFDNIAFGPRSHNPDTTSDEIESKVRRVLALVNLDDEVLTKFPAELSYGMQKRASLARTLATEPEYLLYDEPTTALDPVTTAGINALIKSLSEELGVTSIVVSHDMPSALELADRILVLDGGKIVEEGPAERVRLSEVPLVKDFMIQSGVRDA